MSELTLEERTAVAIVKMRLWGIHPTWVEHFINTNKVPHIVEEHEEIQGDKAGEQIADMFLKPRSPIGQPEGNPR